MFVAGVEFTLRFEMHGLLDKKFTPINYHPDIFESCETWWHGKLQNVTIGEHADSNLPNCMYRNGTQVVAIVDTLLTDTLHLYARSRFRTLTSSRTTVMKSSSMRVLSFHTRSQKFCVQFPLSSVDHAWHIGSLSSFAC